MNRNSARGDRSSRSYKLHDPLGYLRFVLDREVQANLALMDLEVGSRVLDYGCGTQPYRRYLPPGCEYLGADLPENPLADITIVDGGVDLPNDSVDLVISTQVLEHVPDPHQYLSECRRVLRPGGKLLLSTHGVMFYHPGPADLWRWTAEGLALAMSRADLQVESINPLVGAVPTGIWLVMMNVQWRLPYGLRHAFVALLSLAMRWTDRPSVSRLFPSDWDYVVVARRAQSSR